MAKNIEPRALIFKKKSNTVIEFGVQHVKGSGLSVGIAVLNAKKQTAEVKFFGKPLFVIDHVNDITANKAVFDMIQEAYEQFVTDVLCGKKVKRESLILKVLLPWRW